MCSQMLLFLATAYGLAVAQSDYPIQSAPFNLVLSSTVNSTLNGIKLAGCHAGALVEALCIDQPSVSTPEFQTLYFNTSTTPPLDPNTLVSGLLTRREPGNPAYSESMALLNNPASNLAFPMIWPSNEMRSFIAFTTEDLLAVPASVNDAITPPGPYRTGTTFWNNRWQICQTYFQGYSYVALQWTLGDREPQNPSCQAVTVKRVFVE
ncbi:hypothetical protein HD806DRAFT_508670 [Xylariaceae sp. AK1471]|nr:hypothetical protein HD806DRAFT_508670 [Xylariaceae sp. AK1471]